MRPDVLSEPRGGPRMWSMLLNKDHVSCGWNIKRK